MNPSLGLLFPTIKGELTVVELYCSQPDRLQDCVACPIEDGDEASITALNALMRSVDPNRTKYRDLHTWAQQVSESYPGADAQSVEQAALEHSAGNCTSKSKEI